MVQLTRIYTRGGDKGKTSLGDGKRVPKNADRIKAIGEVDAANSAIGVAILYASSSIKKILLHIQNDLFDLGADLCIPNKDEDSLKVSKDQVTWLEEHIDDLNAKLQPLKSFVLPGGSKSAAFLHVARTEVRSAERAVIDLEEQEGGVQSVAQYLNRLSDLIFVLCRIENDLGKADVLWQPGKNQ
jgi:cob(I)alamin adenosyltransferase